MSNEALFSATGNAFLVAWLALFVAVFLSENTQWRAGLLYFGGRVIPIALLVVFLAGLLLHRDLEPRGNLFTYEGMLLLFAVPERVLNLWVEVLAYALLVCRWMIDHATKSQVNKVALLTGLLVAFISGGMGILVYATFLMLRATKHHISATHRPISTDGSG